MLRGRVERPVTELAQELGMAQPGRPNTCGCSRGRAGAGPKAGKQRLYGL